MGTRIKRTHDRRARALPQPVGAQPAVVGAAPRTLFDTHLDLTPLRGRREGLVRCPFHDDRTPSLSVDLDRGVFHCFGCGEGGGRHRFAALVGVSHLPADGPRPRESALQVARRDAWRRELRRLEEYREWIGPLFEIADFIRRSTRAIRQAREVATLLGPNEPRVWRMLEHATEVEREALAVEAEVDSILRSGRIA